VFAVEGKEDVGERDVDDAGYQEWEDESLK
jgi:hypothetical protein